MKLRAAVAILTTLESKVDAHTLQTPLQHRQLLALRRVLQTVKHLSKGGRKKTR
jgi:hypothetical protein